MRCRPWLWLWGLLPLALIVFLTTIGERQRVERDLTVRVEQTLQAEGLGWAKLRFEGRDGRLEGAAPSQAERVLAYDIARSIHGVRIMQNNAIVETAVSPYTWQAQRSGNKIELRGYLPNARSQDDALASAKKRFPNSDIIDNTQIAKGAPQGDLWTNGIAFALRQLRHVKTGVINLTDTTIEMAGRATSPASYKQLIDAFRTRLPAGWTLGKQNLDVPEVETYTWSFDRLDGDIVLNGYVPDEATRQRLLAAARKRYPDATITDRMLVAAGAPDGFDALTTAAIEDTDDLEEVRIALQNRNVTVTGLAGTQFMSGDVADRLISKSTGFKVTNRLRARAIVPPKAEPYVWSARQSNNVIIMSGHVPDDDTRRTLIQHARDVYPDAIVRDDMTLATGVPDTTGNWLNAARQGLSVMAMFDKGTADLNGTDLRVGGETRNDNTVARGGELLTRNAPSGFNVTRAFKLLEPDVDLAALARAKEEEERLAAIAAEEEAERQRQEAERLRRLSAERKRRIREREKLVQRAREEAEQRRIVAQTAERRRLSAERKRRIREREELVQRAREEAKQRRVVAQTAERRRLSAERKRRIREREELAQRARNEAEQRRIAAQEVERLRLIEEEEAEQERKRLAALAAEEEAERQRDIAEEKAERERQEAERLRLAALKRAQQEAASKRLIALNAKRQERKKQYRFVAEYNGTPLDLWQARQNAQKNDQDFSTIDETAFEKGQSDSRGRIVLSGKVGSVAMRIALRRHARAQFDGDVVDRLEVIDGADDPDWQTAAMESLEELSRLRNGATLVTQSSVQLYGDAVSGDSAQAVRSSIDRDAPARFDVTSLVTAPKVLKKKVVEKALENKASVEASECGNLMNSVATFAPIRFTSESAEIRKVDTGTLNKLTTIAEKCPRARIRIAGHTDSRGPEAYNQKLSEERAEAVMSYLTQKGIPRDRLRARGLGESQPLVSNDTRADRKKNRRIEFTVTEQ